MKTTLLHYLHSNNKTWTKPLESVSSITFRLAILVRLGAPGKRGVEICILLSWFTRLCAQSVPMLVQMCVQFVYMSGSGILVEELQLLAVVELCVVPAS
jgi:hypothetical protein